MIPITVSLFIVEYHQTIWMRQYSVQSNIAGANSRAKDVFEWAAGYAIQVETHNGEKVSDGIYTGSLRTSQKYEGFEFTYSGDVSDMEAFLKNYCGFLHYGYYCIGFKNGLPFAAYWGDTDQVLIYAPNLIYAAEQGSSLENGDTVYYGGYTRVGCYPLYSVRAKNGVYHLSVSETASSLPVYGEQARTPAWVYDIPIEIRMIRNYIVLSVIFLTVDIISEKIKKKKQLKNERTDTNDNI